MFAAVWRSSPCGATAGVKKLAGRLQSAGFLYNETCILLSGVKGSRFHPPQRCSSIRPPNSAIRSISCGQA